MGSIEIKPGRVIDVKVDSLECGGPAPLWSAVSTGWWPVVEDKLDLLSQPRQAKAAPGRRTPRSRP